jgi:hypothetical protein
MIYIIFIYFKNFQGKLKYYNIINENTVNDLN